eukprot:gb/GECG01008811.1/.p1 GENE.gb/GECG01008811.1/~~gb/GECG01008811.1/.p1  ORF type:complete len:851 (+),score=132.34 gb/GECG01008811.1/:1-2553(+)
MEDIPSQSNPIHGGASTTRHQRTAGTRHSTTSTGGASALDDSATSGKPRRPPPPDEVQKRPDVRPPVRPTSTSSGTRNSAAGIRAPRKRSSDTAAARPSVDSSTYRRSSSSRGASSSPKRSVSTGSRHRRQGSSTPAAQAEPSDTNVEKQPSALPTAKKSTSAAEKKQEEAASEPRSRDSATSAKNEDLGSSDELPPPPASLGVHPRASADVDDATRAWAEKERNASRSTPQVVGRLQFLLASWNVGNAKPAENFDPWIPPKGGDYDLIAVSVQESTFSEKKHDEAANESPADEEEDDPGSDDEAPNGDSAESNGNDEEHETNQIHSSHSQRIGDAKKTQLFRMLCEYLSADQEPSENTGDLEDWVVVDCGMLGQAKGLIMEIGLIVFVRRKHFPAIDCIEKGSEATGILRVVANKGGVAVSFCLYGTSFCFVGAHLNAHMPNMEKRNVDVHEILEGIRLRQTALTLDQQFGHTFFMGDLNYRLDRGLVSTDRNRQLLEEYNLGSVDGLEKKDKHKKYWELTKHLIDDKRWDALLEADQLKYCMKQQYVFGGFHEGRCQFPPTFKVSRKPGFEYTNKRIPSYCDRILWSSLPQLEHRIRLEKFKAHEKICTSDHKPVSGSFRLSLTSPVHLRNTSEPPVLRIRHLRGHKLIAKDPTGLSDPYVCFFGDPPGLLRPRDKKKLPTAASTRIIDSEIVADEEKKIVAGETSLTDYAKIATDTTQVKSISVAPKSSMKRRTLNPVWSIAKDELPLLYFRCSSPLELSRTHLIVLLRDYDSTSRDDDMGIAILPLEEVAYGDTIASFKTRVIYQGQAAGLISGEMEVLWPSDPRYSELLQSKIRLPGCRGLCSLQ